MTAPEPPVVPTGIPGPAGPPPGTPLTPTTPQPAPTRSRGRTAGRTLALALLLFVTVLLVLFVVFNTQTVEVSLVFGNVEAPLVLALVIAAALGGLLVWLAGLTRRARRNRKS
ncbi:LapA family protein [Petropleomorpha daqingensis]|uniref:Putative integral membrane protein n=1 Tax=Petropleomorpha daqingensis TaxID=2026353 RepID=A0A853CEX8_9ACTN|nr:putative integral membrane protein [Petropleomorpha daqingensis]